MSPVLNHRFDVLPGSQQALWPLLRPVVPMGFVLYGGTGLALRLGHRVSVAFDFFSDDHLNTEQITRELPFLQGSEIVQAEGDTYTAIVPVHESFVKISFFGGLRFGRIGTPEMTADGVLVVASMADLLATKLKVLMQRIELKDYLDIAAAVRAGYALSHALSGTRVLFGAQFSPVDCLRALEYFQHPDLAGLTAADRETIQDAVRQVVLVGQLPEAELASTSLKPQSSA